MLKTSVRICFFFYDYIYMGEGYVVFGNPISNNDNSSFLSGQKRKKWRWRERSIGWQEVVKEDIAKTVTERRRTELGFHYRAWWNSPTLLFFPSSLLVFFFHLFFIASSLHSRLFLCHGILKRQGLKIWETLIQNVQIDYTIYKYVWHYKCKYMDIRQICSNAVVWLVSSRMPQCLCVCLNVCWCERLTDLKDMAETWGGHRRKMWEM